MKSITKILIIITIGIIIGCDKEDDQDNNDIKTSTVNDELVMIRTLIGISSGVADSITEIQHVGEQITSGEKCFDIDDDGSDDLCFEILDLTLFNGTMPDYLDSLATRVRPANGSILDNSTYGYCDALGGNEQIDNTGSWGDRESYVLGTFANAGNFNGAGDKYVAFRIDKTSNSYYGWFKINCSEHNDTLKFIEYGYNNTPGAAINSGQND